MDQKSKTKKPKAKKPKKVVKQKQKQKQKQSVKVVVNVGKGETETAPRRYTNEIQMYSPPLNIFTQPNLQNEFRQPESNQPLYQMPYSTRQSNMPFTNEPVRQPSFFPEDTPTYYNRNDRNYDEYSLISSPNTEEIVNELTDDPYQINAGIIDRYNEATGKTDYIQTQALTYDMEIHNPMPNDLIEDLSSERRNMSRNDLSSKLIEVRERQDKKNQQKEMNEMGEEDTNSFFNTFLYDREQKQKAENTLMGQNDFNAISNNINDFIELEQPNTQITDITQQEEPSNMITTSRSNNPKGRPKKGQEKVVEEYEIPVANPATGILPLTNKRLPHLQFIAENYNVSIYNENGKPKQIRQLQKDIQDAEDRKNTKVSKSGYFIIPP
jgi:hypothetical protein